MVDSCGIVHLSLQAITYMYRGLLFSPITTSAKPCYVRKPVYVFLSFGLNAGIKHLMEWRPAH